MHHIGRTWYGFQKLQACAVRETGFECEVCGLKTKFKYNLERHIAKKHGKSQPLLDGAESIDDRDEAYTQENIGDNSKPMSIQSLLIELDMESYVDKFVKENVDLEILKSLEDADIT